MKNLLKLDCDHFRIFVLEVILGMAPVAIILYQQGYNESSLKQLTNSYPSNPVALWFISVGILGAVFLIANKYTFLLDFTGNLKIDLLKLSKDFVDSLKSFYIAIAGFTFAIIILGLKYEYFTLKLFGLQCLLFIFAIGSHLIALYLEKAVKPVK